MNTISYTGTLSEFVQTWMYVHVLPRLAPKTAERYNSLAEHVTRELGSEALVTVNAFMLERVYAALRPRLSARTVNHAHQCIHPALVAAVRWDMQPRNPAHRCRLPPSERPEARALGLIKRHV
jgi:hypothetical protein